VGQLPAQVFAAALADSGQLRLAAGSELLRNQTEPRGEVDVTATSSTKTADSAKSPFRGPQAARERTTITKPGTGAVERKAGLDGGMRLVEST
jgi:hypothetical protein